MLIAKENRGRYGFGPMLLLSTLTVFPLSIHAVEVTRVQYLMGTLCEMMIESNDASSVHSAIDEAFGEISRLEGLLSTYRPESEVSLLNQGRFPENQKNSPDLIDLMQQSIFYSDQTAGAFDITLKDLGSRKIQIDKIGQTVKFNSNELHLDFGGIGKGFALDKALEVLKKRGIKKGQLNFSGNLLVFNKGREWNSVVVVNPKSPEKTMLTLRISNGSVSTSSQYEKKGHIKNPRTGQSVDFAGSVTVLSPTATEADALSTALFVLGPVQGLEWLEKNFKNSSALFLVPEGDHWEKIASKNFAINIDSQEKPGGM